MVAYATPTPTDTWSRYLTDGDTASREHLIVQHLPLVKYVIGRLAIHLPQVLDYEDLLGYGTLGLMQALDRFDSARGVKFESFAVMRIRGAILDALRALRGLPQSLTQKAKALQAASLQLEQSLGRPPTDEELAGALKITTAQLMQQMVDSSWVSVSLETMLAGREATGPAFVSHRRESDVVGTVEQRETVRELAGALQELNERERLVLNLYYHEELTMREIGQVLDVTEGRVCQLHARALHKLRVAMAQKMPEKLSPAKVA